MSALSAALETSLLNHLLRATSYTPLGTVHLGLFTADPGESGIVGEVSGGSYARVAITNNTTAFPACSATGSPVKTNGSAFVFPTASAGWGTITHWAVYDSAVGGTNVMLARGTLATPRQFATGDTPRVGAGTLSITLSNSSSGGLTDFAKRKLLDLVFGAIAYTTPATVYVGVGTALTGETLTAWAEPGYTRQSAAFAAPSGGASANSEVLTMNTGVSVNIGPLTHFGIYDDPSLGNALVLASLSTSRSVPLGDFAKFAVSSISVKVA